MRRKGMIAWLLAMLCLPLLAGAEIVTVPLGSQKVISPGETRTYLYTDYSGWSGWNETGLTQDDFVITYSTTADGLKVDADGRVTAEADFAGGYVKARYKPMKSSVGSARDFSWYFASESPLVRITAAKDVMYLFTGDTARQTFTLTGNTNGNSLDSVSYDDSLLTVKKSSSQSKGKCLLDVTALKAGESRVTVRTYNDIIKSFRVIVAEPVTQLTFSSDHFTCYTGDTIQLGLDLGNGPNGGAVAQWHNWPTTAWGACEVRRFGQITDETGTSLADDSFYTAQSGEYTIYMKAGDYEGRTKVSVYDRVDAASVSLSQTLVVGKTAALILRDAQGNEIYRPFEITAGADCTTRSNMTLTGVQAGTFTVTVYNADGSSISQELAVELKPTSITLEPSELTLEIGESCTLTPVIDQGAHDCVYEIDYDDFTPLYDLNCIRMEGSTVIAQAPGTATVSIAGWPSAVCKVTVPDSDKAIHIELPTGNFGTGDTFQLKVVDRTGKEYPVKRFYSSWAHVDVTEDGLMTGVKAGTCSVGAVLEDGRSLKSETFTVVQKPAWMKHDNILAAAEVTAVALGEITSDVGTVPPEYVTVIVENESVVTYSSGYFFVQGPGVTTVWLKNIYNGLMSSFTFEVLADTSLYVGSAEMEVPEGCSALLPMVTDADGNEVPVTWAITHETAGQGNPYASGYQLEGNIITSLWHKATCVMTGTAASGATVKVYISSYKLPQAITLNVTQNYKTQYNVMDYTIDLRDGAAVFQVAFEGEDCEIRYIYWAAEDPAVATVSREVTSGAQGVAVYPQAVGKTRIAAMLDNGAYAICSITVIDSEARLPGDANEDGGVNAEDALLVMQHAAGWPVQINGYAGDVNADSLTNLADALLLFQYHAGLDVQLKQYIPGD